MFTSQIFGVVGHLGENLHLFSPLGFDVQQLLITKPQKSQPLLSQSFKTLSEWEKST